MIKLKSHWPKFLAILILVLLIGSYAKIFAISQPYNPGETLDPSCPPGEINCTVLITGGSSVWTTTGNDIYYNTGNVGIGINTPSQALEIDGNAIINGIFLGKGTGSGSSNIALGNSNLQLNTIGYNNVGIGEAALQANTTGGENIAIGIASLNFNETGSRNIAIGPQSLNAESTQDDNVAIGYQAGLYSVGGGENVLIGNYVAGSVYGNISNSVMIGFNAGYNAAGVNNIFLGSNAGAFETGSNKLIIDNLLRNPAYAQEQALIYGVSNTTPANQTLSLGGGGNVGIGTTTPTARLHLSAGTAAVGTAPLKLTSGTNLTSPEAGAMEWDGTNLFVTQTSGPTRRTIAYTSDIISPPISIVNTSNLFATGISAGTSVTATTYSNFFGIDAGDQATAASNSNFLGRFAGYLATSADSSNFFGPSAGNSAPNANASNFFGYQAGYNADNANNSNFFGNQAGQAATNAYFSSFVGRGAGLSAANSSNSIFIGQWAGNADTVNNTGNVDDFSILIGKSTNTGGFSNSIAIGGSATNTASNEFMIGSTTRPINTTVWTGASGTATLDTATGLITTSDERLKKNITDLEDTTLSKLINVRTVKFNWLNGNSDKTNIGFLAQDLENYFPELVYTGTDDYKGVNYANMTPIIVEAIREMDLKVKDLDEKINKLSTSEVVKEFFGGVLIGITDGVAYLKNIVVESLKVGSPEKRTGITLYDEETGEPYCLSISGGQTKTKIGECGVVTPLPEIVIEKEEIEIIETEDDVEIISDEILTEEIKEEEQELNVIEENIVDQNENIVEEVDTQNTSQAENTEERQNPTDLVDN